MVEAACRLFIQDLDTYVTSYGNEEEPLSYFETNSDDFLKQLVDFYASLQQQNLTENSLAYELFNQTLDNLISTRTIDEQERYSSEEGEELEEDDGEDDEEYDDSKEDEEIEETEKSENEEGIEETEGPELELEEYYQDGGIEEADEVDEDDDSEEAVDPSEEDDYEYEEWEEEESYDLTPDQESIIQQQFVILLSTQDSLTQFFQGFVSSISDEGQINVPALSQLLNNSQEVLLAVSALQAQLVDSGFRSTDIPAIQNFLTLVAEFLNKNQNGLASLSVIGEPYIKAFLKDPSRFSWAMEISGEDYDYLLPIFGNMQNQLLAGHFYDLGASVYDVFQNILALYDEPSSQ